MSVSKPLTFQGFVESLESVGRMDHNTGYNDLFLIGLGDNHKGFARCTVTPRGSIFAHLSATFLPADEAIAKSTKETNLPVVLFGDESRKPLITFPSGEGFEVDGVRNPQSVTEIVEAFCREIHKLVDAEKIPKDLPVGALILEGGIQGQSVKIERVR
jgi:hypothetical protein